MAIAKRKKKFFEVEIPLIKKQTQLWAFDKKELEGRNIKYDLTRQLRGKSTLLVLKVKLIEEKLIANPKKIKLMPYFLKKMVRKGTNYVEDSFSAICKDSQIRLKPFLVTRRKVSRAVRKALREKTRDELTDYVKNKTSKILFEEILKNHIQKKLSLKLKKIYPLSLCEIRVISIEKEFEQKLEENKQKPKSKKDQTEETEKINEVGTELEKTNEVESE